MTEYSWHVQRADVERERAALAEDDVVRRLHQQLAALHLRAAADLSETWRIFRVPEDHIRAFDSPLEKFRPLLAGVFGAEPEPALMPPALLVDPPRG